MKCPHCQSDVPENLKFCGECGRPLEPAVCSGCGFENPAQFKFCGNCGIPLIASTALACDTPAFNRRAERRQLTVLFCDLKDSVALSSRLDPEDFRALLMDYRRVSGAVIERFGGAGIRYIGDGIRVYFGYPQAHEDDAERAVRAGLGIVAEIEALNASPQWQGRAEVVVRIGIATGLVVAGSLNADASADEKEAVGETPNLAARLQAQAPGNAVVVAPGTKRLLGDLFEYADLGAHALKGFAKPVQVWQVVCERAMDSRFEATRSPGTPLVGRADEIDLIMRRWRRASLGEGQVVLLAGEAGIGKSRITRVLRDRIEEPHHRLHYQCSPYHTNSALYPIIVQLERDAHFGPTDSAAVKLDKLEASLKHSSNDVPGVAPLLAALLSIPTDGRYPPLDMSPQRQKEKTLAVLSEQMRGLATHRPLLAIFEDAHWIDPTSQELLDLGVKACQDSAVLLVIAFRPDFVPPWAGQPHVGLIMLSRLNARESAMLAQRVAGDKALPAEVTAQIVARTEGVPLFIEELTKTVLDSGLLSAHEDHYELNGPLPPLAIPSTLQDSLMARLDQLSPAKAIAQMGAVIGREFSFELLAAIAPLAQDKLRTALATLVESDLLQQWGSPPQASYTFRHALLQEAAYNSLLRSRRQELHAAIGRVLEQRFPREWETQPELLAYHYTEAGLAEKAVEYWLQAGKRAAERSANKEAISHLQKGLERLPAIAEATVQQAQELALRIALGPLLIALRGPGTQEVEQNYARALELCAQVPESPLHFAAYWGWWRTAENFRDMDERAQKLQLLAERLGDSGLLLQAHHARWASLFALGDQQASYEHIKSGLRLYEMGDYRSHAAIYGGHDAKVCGHGEAALVLWLLGFPERAERHCEEALAYSLEVAHAASRAHALDYVLMLQFFYRDARRLRADAGAALKFCEEQGFDDYRARAMVFWGWATAVLGETARGIAAMQEGIKAQQSTGTTEDFPIFFEMLSEAQVLVGRIDEALASLAEAFAKADVSEIRLWDAELYRRRGELLLLRSVADSSAAERCFKEALLTAERQSAKSLQLRAATSLAQLMHRQGDDAQAYRVLAPIEGWFSEGDARYDRKCAKTLLDALRL